MNKKYRIIYNADPDGDILAACPDVTPDTVTANLDKLAGTQVDCYVYSVCAGDMLTIYPSRVGEMVGADLPPGENIFVDKLKKLLSFGQDPIEIFGARAKRHGMDFFASVRMNDSHHKSAQRGIWASRFWINNQQYRNWEIRDGGCYYNATLNYKFPLVRKRRMDIIKELLENYELDGIELDFGRNPYLFNPSEAWELRDIATKFVAEIRNLCELYKRKLMIRVPAYDEQLISCGIDLKNWMERGLADIYSMSCLKGNDYNLNLIRWQDLAGHSKAQLYGGIEMDIANNAPAWNYNAVSLPEHICGIAANYHSQNLDGIYLFNYKDLLSDKKYHECFLKLLNVIGDRDSSLSSPRTYAFYRDLPIELEVGRPPQYGQELIFSINREDLSRKHSIELSFNITNITPECSLAFLVNGKKVASKKVTMEYKRDGLQKGGPGISLSRSGYVIGAVFAHYRIELNTADIKAGQNRLGIKSLRGPLVEHTQIYVFDLEVKVKPEVKKINRNFCKKNKQTGVLTQVS
jgi:hypothetical protein